MSHMLENTYFSKKGKIPNWKNKINSDCSVWHFGVGNINKLEDFDVYYRQMVLDNL